MPSDALRQAANAASVVFAIAVNIVATTLPLNDQFTDEISNRFDVYFVPAGYVFSIWGILYLGWLAFVVFQYLPAQKGKARLRRLGYWFALSGVLNAVVVVLLGLALIAVEVLFRNRTIQEAATELVAPIYIGMPLGLLVALHALLGWRATLLLIGTVAVSDSAQYYSGRAFGRRPLAPTISPKKTVEGAIGGVVVGTAFMAIAGRWALPVVATLPLALAGIVVVVLGIAGDLFESRLKRVAGVKDSSTLIPGHGGVLDRIDALLFAAPAFYVYLQAR